MIFTKAGAEQARLGLKTVTRRVIAHQREENPVCAYRVGEDYAVQPGRGAKAICRIKVTKIERERLRHSMNGAEAFAEGFPSLRSFILGWCRINGAFDPEQWVWRIEFEVVESTR